MSNQLSEISQITSLFFPVGSGSTSVRLLDHDSDTQASTTSGQGGEAVQRAPRESIDLLQTGIIGTLTFDDFQTQYEIKQYKKGLKAADTILKKYPNHGGMFDPTDQLICC